MPKVSTGFELGWSVIDELNASGKFTLMDIQTDEDEHSMEMHLPYIRKIFEG
jgi:predicted class III extradiol MEMO1 family dioxygenase